MATWIKVTDETKISAGSHFVKIGKYEDKACWTRQRIMQFLTEMPGEPLYYLDEAPVSIPEDVKDKDQLTIDDYKEIIEDHKRLVKELDVILNGVNAATQASLCDIISQLKSKKDGNSSLNKAITLCKEYLEQLQATNDSGRQSVYEVFLIDLIDLLEKQTPQSIPPSVVEALIDKSPWKGYYGDRQFEMNCIYGFNTAVSKLRELLAAQPMLELENNKLKDVHEWVEHVVKEIGMIEGKVASVSKYGGSMVVRYENKHGYIVSINKANRVHLDEVQSSAQSIQQGNVEVLKQAVEIIKGWHNMGSTSGRLTKEQIDLAWKIYYENAPEMKSIRETLSQSSPSVKGEEKENSWVELMQEQIDELAKIEGQITQVKKVLSSGISIRFEKNAYWLRLDKQSKITTQ